MSNDAAPDVKLVAFWPAASGGVESIAMRLGPSLPEPFSVRLTSDAEPRLCALAGWVGFALISEVRADGPFAAPDRVRLSHLRRAPAEARAGARRS